MSAPQYRWMDLTRDYWFVILRRMTDAELDDARRIGAPRFGIELERARRASLTAHERLREAASTNRDACQ